MNQVSAVGQAITFATGYQAELWADRRKKDGFWVEVPRRSLVETFPELCQIDMWGEKVCTTLDDYPRGEGKTISCKAAYVQDKEFFEQVLNGVESENWTKKEMKKVLQWVFNCTGKLPVQRCAQPSS